MWPSEDGEGTQLPHGFAVATNWQAPLFYCRDINSGIQWLVGPDVPQIASHTTTHFDNQVFRKDAESDAYFNLPHVRDHSNTVLWDYRLNEAPAMSPTPVVPFLLKNTTTGKFEIGSPHYAAGGKLIDASGATLYTMADESPILTPAETTHQHPGITDASGNQVALQAMRYAVQGKKYLSPDVSTQVLQGYLHPNGAAHSALAWLLEDKRFVEKLELSVSVTAYLFGGSAGSVAVIAPRAGMVASWAPPALPRLDLYGNPVAPGSALDRYVSYVLHDGDAAGFHPRVAEADGDQFLQQRLDQVGVAAQRPGAHRVADAVVVEHRLDAAARERPALAGEQFDIDDHTLRPLGMTLPGMQAEPHLDHHVAQDHALVGLPRIPKGRIAHARRRLHVALRFCQGRS